MRTGHTSGASVDRSRSSGQRLLRDIGLILAIKAVALGVLWMLFFSKPDRAAANDPRAAAVHLRESP